MQQDRRQQTSEPWDVLERRDPVPGIERERGDQGCGPRDDGAPVREAFVVVLIEIIDQRIAGFLPQGVAGEPLRGAADGRLDGGEGIWQSIRSTLSSETVHKSAVVGGSSLSIPGALSRCVGSVSGSRSPSLFAHARSRAPRV